MIGGRKLGFIKFASVAPALSTGFASAQYTDGFVWQRSLDYDTGVDGSTWNNPNSDSLGTPVWHMGWVDKRAGTPEVPWFAQPPSSLVWDSNWFTTGLPRWVRSNDTPGCVDQNHLIVADTYNANEYFVPVVTWTNPAPTMAALQIVGPSWVGWSHRPTPGQIEILLARRSVAGDLSVLLQRTFDKPTNDNSVEWLSFDVAIEHVLVEPGGQLVLSVRKLVPMVLDENITWLDGVLSISVVSACPADVNEDGSMNSLDVLEFLNAWNGGEPSADFHPDGIFDTRDIAAFLNAWSAGCP